MREARMPLKERLIRALPLVVLFLSFSLFIMSLEFGDMVLYFGFVSLFAALFLALAVGMRDFRIPSPEDIEKIRELQRKIEEEQRKEDEKLMELVAGIDDPELRKELMKRILKKKQEEAYRRGYMDGESDGFTTGYVAGGD
ncbi:MAG: hypothetical protein DSY42_00600 [Aquifex sp.]|nr:MAG: hypothetical protein DSY42_00600 [Aquifex sp.]